MCFQVIQNHAGKLRSMTGGMASLPIVFILEMTGQTPGFAGQHSDYEIDTYYAHIPGVKTVVPSTPSDAKGMMVSAIRDPNPVVYLYPAGLRDLMEDVPDNQYTVPLDKAVLRTTGSDITIVGSGASMPEVMQATEKLQKQGMKVEAIDLRSLKPMDTETLVKSVQKTKYLLTVDQSYYTLCPGAEVIARCAENVVRRALQARGLPRRAAAGGPGDVQLDAAQRRPCGRGRDETARIGTPHAAALCNLHELRRRRRAPRGCPLGLLA